MAPLGPSLWRPITGPQQPSRKEQQAADAVEKQHQAADAVEQRKQEQVAGAIEQQQQLLAADAVVQAKPLGLQAKAENRGANTKSGRRFLARFQKHELKVGGWKASCRQLQPVSCLPCSALTSVCKACRPCTRASL